MTTRIDEIAPRIYRVSTYIPQVAPPAGFTFNQFLIDADEPLLFHCGYRMMFPAVSAAVARVVPIDRLRWIAFGHYESDESGSMNEWLAAAPRSQVAQGVLSCEVMINDAAVRPPRALANGEVIDLGGKRVRHVDTPHLPHGWDARVLYEETTGTLLCGDLFAHVGNVPPLTDADIVEPAVVADDLFKATCITPETAPTIRGLAELDPRTLGLMHGSSFRGNGGAALHALADHFDRRLRASTEVRRDKRMQG